MPGTRLIDKDVILSALHATTPSSSTPVRVSMKGYNHLTIFISAKNATTVTGSAITLKQSQDVSGTAEKRGWPSPPTGRISTTRRRRR